MSAARILVVDDNVELAENIQEILEEEGSEVTVAPGGNEALTLLDARRFDMVITDMRMPGISGLEVLRYIRARWPELPVVLMTAYSRDTLLEAARAEGAVHILGKPLDLDHLQGVLARCVTPTQRLLLVEDDPHLRADLCESIQSLPGVLPISTGRAGEAIAVAEAGGVDLAVVDLHLPDGDGVALARALRERLGPDLPVIFITGDQAPLQEALAGLLVEERVTLVEKPFSPDALVDTVRSLV